MTAQDITDITRYTLQIQAQEIVFQQDYMNGLVGISDYPQATVLARTTSAKLFRVAHKHWAELCWTLERIFKRTMSKSAASSSELRSNFPLMRPIWAGPVENLSGSDRIFLDVSHTSRLSAIRTDVQRVAWRLLNRSYSSGRALPIVINNAAAINFFQAATSEVVLEPDDIVVILDFPSVGELRNALLLSERSRSKTVAIVYDMTPIKHPGLAHPGNTVLFQEWFSEVVSRSDAIITFSRSVADEIVLFASNLPRVKQEPLRVGYISLGADFAAKACKATKWKEKTVFLGVGTIEPGKGWPIAVDAMERLWAEGVDAHFVLVGAYGWSMRAFQSRMEQHKEYGKRLHWLRDADEALVARLYSDATCVICPSVAEGFAFSLVEARHYGIPTIASNIPVFREIAGDTISYFTALNSEDLAARMRDALCTPRIPSFEVATWEDASKELLALASDLVHGRSNARRIT